MEVKVNGRYTGSNLGRYPKKCPFRYKWQLVDWAEKYFELPRTRFNKMAKKQLYAIWYNTALPLS